MLAGWNYMGKLWAHLCSLYQYLTDFLMRRFTKAFMIVHLFNPTRYRTISKDVTYITISPYEVPYITSFFQPGDWLCQEKIDKTLRIVVWALEIPQKH